MLVFALAVLVLVPAGSCQGGLIQFSLDPNYPVILGINGSLTYNAATQQFHSETDLLTYSADFLPTGFVFFSSGRTVIDLLADSAGNLVSGLAGLKMTGELDLDEDGTIDVAGDAATPLLFGQVLAFGAEAAGPPTRVFNGLWEIQGGKLTETIALSGGGSVFGGFPQGPSTSTFGGFFLFAENVTSGTLGDFTSDFSSDSVKDNVGVVTPEPTSLAMGLAGGSLLGAFGYVRRRGLPLVRPSQTAA